MADKREAFENIKDIGALLEAAGIPALLGENGKLQKRMGDILKKLGDKERALTAERQEREAIENERLQKEASEVKEPVKTVQKEPEPVSEPIKVEPVESEPKPKVKPEKTEAVMPTAEVKESPEVKEPVKAQAETHPQGEKAQQPKPEHPQQGDRTYQPRTDRPYQQGDRTYQPRTDRPQQGDRTYQPRTDRPYQQGDRTYQPRTDRPQQGDRTYQPRTDRPQQGDRTYQPRTDRPYQPGEQRTYQPRTDRPYQPGEQRTYQPRTDRPYQQGDRPYQPRTDRPQQGDRPYQPRTDRPYQQGDRPYQPRTPGAPRPSGAPIRRTDAPAILPKDNKAFPAKKKPAEKSYEEKKAISKRALVKQQVSVEDFDEDKSGYRKLRTKKGKVKEEQQFIKIEKAVIATELIPLKVLSEKIGISAVEITKKLFKEGIIKTINDTVDFDTAAYIASDLGIELELRLEKTAEDVITEFHQEEGENDINLITRPPVITVMGHVDHGKTSLLDRIRSANVADGEAGGITQHIGAYSVTVRNRQITFLDTPGHEAFTSMRARGAQVTDIAIIVVAADDGIMPQTIEAINHAKAAGVTVVVAANKIDKQSANLDKVKQQLADQNVLIEEWGGEVIFQPVSAKTGEGIDKLLDTIILLADVKDLKANPDRKAKGVIIEAQLDKGKGPVATVLVQNGTLRTGDSIVAGTVLGRVRAMIDDKGRTVKQAGPSTAVSILGLEDVPNTGDNILAVEQEKLSKLVAEERKNKERVAMTQMSAKLTLDDVFKQNLKTLNLIIKADVQGSTEAVKQSLEKITSEEVVIRVIHSAAGAINESDVMLADSAKAIIIGFNVRPDVKAKALAERNSIDIRLYRIIYEAIDDVEKALKGLQSPKYSETLTGKAQVRETFKITGVGMVAGCYVTEGKILRSGKLRIYRNDIMITEGSVRQLKRFKDDVKEVAQGYECGISIEDFSDIKNDDIIECYLIERIN